MNYYEPHPYEPHPQDPQRAIPAWRYPVDVKIFCEDSYIPAIGAMLNFAAELEVYFDGDVYTVKCTKIHTMDPQGDYTPMVGEGDLIESVRAALMRWCETADTPREHAIETAEHDMGAA